MIIIFYYEECSTPFPGLEILKLPDSFWMNIQNVGTLNIWKYKHLFYVLNSF